MGIRYAAATRLCLWLDDLGGLRRVGPLYTLEPKILERFGFAKIIAAVLQLLLTRKHLSGPTSLALVISLFILLNWSYSTAVFTDPGTPSRRLSSANQSRHGYSHLPIHEPEEQPELPAFTVKASGGARFCKKCQTRKPDRAHHCSTCNACRLKMDHHCPWLATCVGLRNYKPFILFCVYTTLFCYMCFAIAASYLWSELGTEDFVNNGSLTGVNVVLLAVLSSIIGVVLTGFTGWHLSLAVRNQTTIECLEKTRYLTNLRRSMHWRGHPVAQDGEESSSLLRYGQQLKEIHANALPGITRSEEGEERPSPALDGTSHPADPPLSATQSLRQNYESLERQRERQRYEEYLDEKGSEKLPHAFDLGWRRNLRAVFGPTPLLWLLPFPNSLGDGWHWEPSARWLAARDGLREQREAEWREQELRERHAGWGRPTEADSITPGSSRGDPDPADLDSIAGSRQAPVAPGQKASRSVDRHARRGFSNGTAHPNNALPMQPLKRPQGAGMAEDAASLDGLYSDDDRRSTGDSASPDRLRSRQRQTSQENERSTRMWQDGWQDWG